MKMTVLALDPPLGSDTYVWRPATVSTLPTGVPSCTLPDRQQSLMPIFVDIFLIGVGE